MTTQLSDDHEVEKAIDQIVEVNQARASFYRMLASLFYRELSQEKIEELSQGALKDLAAEDDTMGEGYRLIAQAVRRPDGTTRQKFASDYARVFLAAGEYDDHRATPYESVFTSEDGLLMQDARDDVYRLYCNEHIGVRENSNEPEDHISFELEFMADMADRCNAALNGSDFIEARRLSRLSVEFLHNHLLNWIDDFCDAIDAAAHTKLYLGVSKLARGFIYDDKEMAGDIAELIDGVADSVSEDCVVAGA